MPTFKKYHGIGNDFLVFEGRDASLPKELMSGDKQIIKHLCNRRFGIGADGVIIALKSSKGADVQMKIYNSDGTQAEMCGNGARCFVKFLIDNDPLFSENKQITIETLSGVVKSELGRDKLISIDMGCPFLEPQTIPTLLNKGLYGLPQGKVVIEKNIFEIYAVGMGNPHMIIYVDDLDLIPIDSWGKLLETNSMFPNKTNVHFVKRITSKKLEILVWERGCGATLACGTGACAVLVASHSLGLCESQAEIVLPGGTLNINWPDKNKSVYMEGDAKHVFSGEVELTSLSLL